MELSLIRQEGTQVAVSCDGQPSHTFDLRRFIPDDEEASLPHPLTDPVTYGQAAYQALFPPESPARQRLVALNPPGRLVLVTTDDALQAVPWEYAHSGSAFVVQEHHLMRGVPPEQRIAPPVLDSGLHIVAVPSDPLDVAPPLNIEGEWTRLTEAIRKIESHVTLERVHPAALGALRSAVANQHHRVIHFMGHGTQHEGQAVLCFESRQGGVDAVTTQAFVGRVRGTALLVTLNACVSAHQGETEFSNLASALVAQQIPYALGMRFVVVDEDALTLSHRLYDELARGASVEAAVYQMRLELADSPRPWAIGVPVLYTALEAPAPGFQPRTGAPEIIAAKPRMALSSIPPAQSKFRGRVEHLLKLGEALTGDHRPQLLTIHGVGGQGKTTLAREAAERFAWAWPGGVWAVSLENLPTRAAFVVELAHFLDIATDNLPDPLQVERQVRAALAQQRVLIVLDNAETLIQAVAAGDEEARALARWLREDLPGSPTSLLVTSREVLGWPGEITFDLGGLDETEGALLFHQSAPQRQGEIDLAQAQGLSSKVQGHPLSLLLLGGAFNSTAASLADFMADYEARLLNAENPYARERHQTLYASIDTSVQHLPDAARELLSGLWIFHAPFLPETAETIFDPDTEYADGEHSPVYDQLYLLWQRGLLERQGQTFANGNLRLYRLLPTVRPYTERYLAQADEQAVLLRRFGAAYAALARLMDHELDRDPMMAYLALQMRDDLTRGLEQVEPNSETHGYYLLHWGWVQQRLGDRQIGMQLTEAALELAQGRFQELELHALNNLALVYRATGQPEQALPIQREVGDRAGEAATLNNLAMVYDATGQPDQALALHEQALPIRRAVGDRAGEAVTLNNIALVYRATGQPDQALALYQQALSIRREVGDRAGEAATLNNLAMVYYATGQPDKALVLFEQALPIQRAVGNRAGEAATLNNMAAVYRATGQPDQALALYQQALPIVRAVGNRAGEAATLHNMALVYEATGQPERALALYQQALPIRRAVGDRAGEATTLNNLAGLLFEMGDYAGAIDRQREAVALMEGIGLAYDAGGTSLEEMKQMLARMEQGTLQIGPATLPAEELRFLISNTVAVMTTISEKQAGWREVIAQALKEAEGRGPDWQIEVELYTAVLAVLDGQPPLLPEDHPYAETLAQIEQGIAQGGLPEPDSQPASEVELLAQAVLAFVQAENWAASRQVIEDQQALLLRPEVEQVFEAFLSQVPDNPQVRDMLDLHRRILRACRKDGIEAAFAQIETAPQADAPAQVPDDFVAECLKGFRGTPQDKMAAYTYLSALLTDGPPGLGALVAVAQAALFMPDPTQADSSSLEGTYAEVWRHILNALTGGNAP